MALAMRLYRVSHRCHKAGWRRLSKALDRLNYLFFNCFVPGSASIGEGSRLAYGGIGVVIHSHSRIGRGVLIGQGVTLGAKEAFVSADDHPSPIVEDNVYIATGAKLLGGINIGHSSIVAANAVVLISCPPHSVLAGVPARIVGKTEDDYQVYRL